MLFDNWEPASIGSSHSHQIKTLSRAPHFGLCLLSQSGFKMKAHLHLRLMSIGGWYDFPQWSVDVFLPLERGVLTLDFYVGGLGLLTQKLLIRER